MFTIKQLNQFDYIDYQGIIEYLDTNLIPGEVKDVPRYEEKLLIVMRDMLFVHVILLVHCRNFVLKIHMNNYIFLIW